MYDINPTQQNVSFQATSLPGGVIVGGQSSATYSTIPCCGYAKLSIKTMETSSSKQPKYAFQYADGSVGEFESTTTSWSTWIDIPQNAVAIRFQQQGSTGSDFVSKVYYSLLTADSPYNPDN